MIEFTGTRPKLDLNTVLNLGLVHDTPTESATKYTVKAKLNAIEPDDFTINLSGVSITSGATVITSTENTFSKCRIGDVLTADYLGSPLFDTNTKITSVSSTGDSIEFDLGTLQAVTNDNVILNVDPGSINPTLFILELTYGLVGYTLTIVPKIYLFNGYASSNISSGEDGLGVEDASDEVAIQTVSLDIDSFLTKLRETRDN